MIAWFFGLFPNFSWNRAQKVLIKGPIIKPEQRSKNEDTQISRRSRISWFQMASSFDIFSGKANK